MSTDTRDTPTNAWPRARVLEDGTRVCGDCGKVRLAKCKRLCARCLRLRAIARAVRRTMLRREFADAERRLRQKRKVVGTA